MFYALNFILLAADRPAFLPHIYTAQIMLYKRVEKCYLIFVVVQASGHARRSASASIPLSDFNETTS